MHKLIMHNSQRLKNAYFRCNKHPLKVNSFGDTRWCSWSGNGTFDSEISVTQKRWVAKCSISLVVKWYILIVWQCSTHLWEVRQSSTGPKMTWWTKFYIFKGRWTMLYWSSWSSRTKFYKNWVMLDIVLQILNMV